MKTRIIWVVLSCLMVVALVLASCGPAEEKGEKETVKGETTKETIVVVEEKEEKKEEVAAVAKGPQYGGSLTEARSYSPAAHDPTRAISHASSWDMHFEQLLIGDVEGAGPRGKNLHHFGWSSGPVADSLMIPHLAESWEFITPTHIQIKVRKGIKFHNKAPAFGRELDAYDVEATFLRVWDVPRFKGRYWIFVDSIEATDKYTVDIMLNRFDRGARWYLGCGYYIEIAPREAFEQGVSNDWKYLCGTGPYIMKEFIADVGATWVRNPDYWDTTTIDGKEYKLPFTDTHKMLVIVDSSTRLAGFRTGKLDFIYNINKVDYDSIISTATGVEVLKVLQLGSVCSVNFRVDLPDSPVYDKDVRKALFMAIDGEDMLAKLVKGDGILRWTHIVPVGWDPAMETPYEDLPDELVEAHTFNPAGAKALLAEAGYPDGFKAKLGIWNTPYYADYASLLSAYWKEHLNVEVAINPYERAVYEANVQKGGHEEIVLFWLGSGPIDALGTSAVGNQFNPTRHGPAGWDDMIDDALATMDDAAYAVKLKEMNILHALEFHTHRIINPQIYNLWWPWVKNYSGEVDTSWLDYAPVFARAWVDVELKKSMGY